MEKTNILMCCSELSVKGGMVSVMRNYLNYAGWNKFNIIFIPTHTEKNKIVVALYFLKAYIRILFTLLRKNISIAHLHTAERGSFFRKAILVRTFKLFGVKTVMHHHAAEFEQFYKELSERKKKYVNHTLEMVDVNIVLSKNLISMITNKAPKARVEVLYNAVSVPKSNEYDLDTNHILFLGRLGKRKGTYDLLQAIKNIDNKIPEKYKFDLCGDGEIDEVKKKIKELQLEKRIDFVGWVDIEKKKEILRKVCINVLPSYNEGLPMSILETMALGIPNIATNIASIPEVIEDGINGFLIKPGDVYALSESILALINNRLLRNQFSEKSYELIKNRFSLDVNIAHLKEIYQEII